ncbi:PREDICTED: elastin-like [Wasmannia auropunctata]|uniref:elastin-like n=1 Tax=Wasmannia auropunctata TaxID=64793 RepID=UPI0005EF53E6|nr:PREDICTED: elastin-like [Wasmannia auropunctata]
MAMRCIVMLAAVLAVVYAQAESEAVGQGPQQTLIAPAASSEVAPLKPETVSGEVAETQSRNKRAPVVGKALFGGAALLGAGALGAGALGAGALGAGALGAGALGAGALGFGAGLHKAKYFGGGYGYPHYHSSPDYHYHYHSYPQYNNYPHYHHYHSYGPGYGYW